MVINEPEKLLKCVTPLKWSELVYKEIKRKGIQLEKVSI